jgi:hypothetical protein
MQTDYKFRNYYVMLYKLLLSALAPCEIRKRYPPTSCILVSFLRFPCGTLAATILQVDNCIVASRAQHFCFFFNLHIAKKTCGFIEFAQIHRIWETWLRFIPFHLLSGVGIYASLLSPAKATNYTHLHIPLFLSSLPHDSDYRLIHGTIQIFFIGSIRLAIFFSLCIGYMSGLPLKTTPVLCRRSSLSLLPGATPFKSIMPRTA